MNESYEVVFERVESGNLYPMLKSVAHCAEAISDLTISENVGGGFAEINEQVIGSMISFQGEVCLVARMHFFKVSVELCLPLVLLRVIKYAGGVDVELSFSGVLPVDARRLMVFMQCFSRSLSARFNVENFYGGLEPAVDVETRYFTGDAWGPLSGM